MESILVEPGLCHCRLRQTRDHGNAMVDTAILVPGDAPRLEPTDRIGQMAVCHRPRLTGPENEVNPGMARFVGLAKCPNRSELDHIGAALVQYVEDGRPPQLDPKRFLACS